MRKNNQSKKTKFRATKKWKEFRNHMRELQKTDPVTGQKLSKLFNLHHLDLNEEHYEDISNEDNFICLNQKTHACVHFFFSKSKPKQWRERLKRIIPILKKMEKLMTAN